ncbi:glycosyl transferase family 41-domain-containing protein [Neohortaea acidophila]|uniref:protein O-GlcNAc transferase n=1 Tax=Neohortaea acidophila TaxID=245834 RepID=A0A6A6PJL8_9PEZI|nr:glycosyl transferase family 41-domain-containing protein [Neohortaea acidophila]KAF2479457.1 glycosyl transferase family 41-domain-containing protein [Neohortaea acidophila]
MSTEFANKTNLGPGGSADSWGSSAWSVDTTPHPTPPYTLPGPQCAFPRYSGDVPYHQHTPRAENTLRRKTPNGTLIAGYDSSFECPSARKHQLVPFPESNVPRGSHAISASAKESHYHRHQQLQSQSRDGWNGSWGAEWAGAQLSQPSNLVLGMDSMLHQMPGPASYAAHSYFGQSIPSVRQPSFQYLGPTASGGQGAGPYGPYWHDGTFEPYRPAAVRDPRFYHHHTSWGSFMPSHAQAAPALGLYDSVHPPAYSVDANYPAALPGLGPFPNTHYFPGQGNPSMLDQAHAFYQQNHTGDSLPAYAAFGSADDIKQEYGSFSPNGQQRDKTFAWALQQYRNLLAFIQRSRKQQQQQQRLVPGQSHVPQRPTFYPRPPKPSRSGSSGQIGKRRLGSDPQQHNTDRNNVVGSQHSDLDTVLDNPSTSDSEFDYNRNRGPARWSATGLHFQDNEYARRSSAELQRDAGKRLPDFVQHATDPFASIQPSSGPSVSTIVSPLPADDSPPSRAAVALTVMTTLCQESDWCWTDGMHLGGCLAYGLGHYEKALKWYRKVLKMDPQHLEASSNLAATLLALGHRLEAEQHWAQVVKTAPNLFEAVEHLVGMYCNDQRTKDAVAVIDHVERSLRQPKSSSLLKPSADRSSDCSVSNASRSPCASEPSDKMVYDFENDGNDRDREWREAAGANEPGFGTSGFAIPGCDNGRILALIHAKGNMLYGLGDYAGAAKAFEEAVLIAGGRRYGNIQELVRHILSVVTSSLNQQPPNQLARSRPSNEPILLTPVQALNTAKLCFPCFGELPGLQHLPGGPHSLARKAVISTTSNALLSLAKIFQDGMSNTNRATGVSPLAAGVRDILALYYLSLSLQPSPSTANNVGILLASVQQATAPAPSQQQKMDIPGVVPGSGVALALQYYNYGLQLDRNHAHLYTNLGSLLKDIGQLEAAIGMYERAVNCDAKFDVALANLANAVKDKGRINDAISYYKRAVEVSPNFAEAVCGLANALNSVCAWQCRGGIALDGGKRDRWHVDVKGMLLDARQAGAKSSGWIKRVVEIVEKQLVDGESWGCGTVTTTFLEELIQQISHLELPSEESHGRASSLRRTLTKWVGQKWEGARVVRLIERATRLIGRQWYHDAHVKLITRPTSSYRRPQLPSTLTVPAAPTVLPFHTFTCPVSAQQIRLISQRNGLRISASTLRSLWISKQVYRPPRPPTPYLRVGYVSSDFNNHPLAHLMQSVFGMHNRKRVKAYCYATTASDNSVHRQQIQSEAPVFHDASGWPAERLVHQIVEDGIHVLVNLNGYTRGARNEVFAARPAPIQMSFMGFAGTLGAEWCDYLLADETAVPQSTLRPWRGNVNLQDQIMDDNFGSHDEEWVYGENIIYCRDTFFCCDHKQSSPDAQEETRATWEEEQEKRWQMRKELFPHISDNTIIFGNFNQLYKIDPTTFRTWLRILAKVKNSILWLLRFPDLGESHLLATARLWAGTEVASRVMFTDVAPKHLHISRARICDLVLDTAECNAHTTAADVLWSGTPLLTLPRYEYKMCSRMAASILKGALPKTEEGARAAKELIATDEDDYEEKAVALGRGLAYISSSQGRAKGRLMELRHMLFRARWSSALFDTQRWVRDLEDAYEEAWRRWVAGEGGDIWLDRIAAPNEG